MSYRISTVAEITGIPRNTLIAWERRYGLLNPERHDNGYRAYTDNDVGILLQIKNALNAGLKISEAVNIVKRQSTQSGSQNGFSGFSFSGQASSDPTRSPYGQFRAQLADLLINYRGDEAKSMLATLVNVPFEIKLHEVFFPVLRDIGDRWECGEVSVAQEHFASGIIRTYLAALFVTTAQQPLGARHAVCTTLPHDEHEIAALALGIHLSQSGYRVSYLGSKMPVEPLGGFMERQRPHLLCVSCITLPEAPEFEDYVRRVGEFRKLGVRVVLGGQLLSGLTPPEGSGVEYYADWRSFVA